ncbi:hypothetical protein SAMN02927937_02007 [Paenimyroides aquimaris]|uniref:Uncharacterized protein n=1 Tax=Paenimyroides marinum TaxID=1159016 RepID=A0A1H6LMA4_9FLAO|nr:hypothetical protein [Paenimyroides aquimaris]SEH89712.1 hypothetical protein SAMN02927937_02007 [Paenimyroides aquimaris]
MEDFKINLFEKEYNRVFIDFEHLDDTQCMFLKKCLNGLFNNNDSIENNLKLNLKVISYVDDINSLSEVFNTLEIFPIEKIYINWYKFDDIDCLYYNDLILYFEDLWFPSSDDIEIFDNTFNWILSIRHDGCISYYKRVMYQKC